ncbi:thiol-disulfide oxidoreductase DCC family protein [Algoriphagus sp. H41]|uniref:Thiol-disulfide oxidoreductase DCC family protein n=1 Tax=Algoriphagus oliviformis TaxID=2811231 RepID=A0ABS3C6B6_9BACT|nr:thiol-disulfide oxidoreductase DCC family protein [Algoriphagus oliviformis]MBN7811690.1 thiol-disulfide oxidoreductase DCC family protein [Algoriphagus oliviformis]
MSKQQSVILFDGVCNLCNTSVDFVLKRDKQDRFLVGALQGEEGQKILSQFGADPSYLDSLVLVEHGEIYFRSTAALRIAKQLPGLWPLLYGLIILPRPVRDGIYDWIGRNRYRWFGKKETCRLPTPEEKAKFL